MSDEQQPTPDSPDSADSPDSTDSGADPSADPSAKADSGAESEPEPEPAPSDATRPAPVGAKTSIPAPVLARGRKRGLDAVAVIAMIAFVLVGGLLVFGYARALVPAAEAQLGAACRPLTPTAKSGPIPELELVDLAGNPVSLTDFRGKYLVVNFWATWCRPCEREWPDLDTLADRLSDREDVMIVAISVDQEAEELAPYLERMGLTDSRVTILRALAPDAHGQWGSEKIPDTYFVNREGEFESVFVNVRAWGRAKAVRCVEAAAG